MDSLADARAEQLLRLGLDLAVRLRDEDPAAARRALDGLDRGDLLDLATLLAACVDITRPVSDVIWWTDQPPARLPTTRRTPQPCGTPAAYRRHRVHGEQPDLACESAYRRYEVARKRQARSDRRAS